MQLTSKQNEYIRNATHRWNIKTGAVRSGKSYVDTAYTIPARIRERIGKPGLTVIFGVSRDTIETAQKWTGGECCKPYQF